MMFPKPDLRVFSATALANILTVLGILFFLKWILFVTEIGLPC